MDTKTDLRIRFKELRKTLDIAGLSNSLCDKLAKSEDFLLSKNIMLYYPLRYEFDLLPLLENSDKNFYLPRVFGKELEVCPYRIGDELVKSEFGPLEPKTLAVPSQSLDLVIVPALAVDKNNYRLGYGGGFYDRFLKNAECKTLVVIAHSQIVEQLPIEAFDIPVDSVIFV